MKLESESDKKKSKFKRNFLRKYLMRIQKWPFKKQIFTLIKRAV